MTLLSKFELLILEIFKKEEGYKSMTEESSTCGTLVPSLSMPRQTKGKQNGTKTPTEQ